MKKKQLFLLLLLVCTILYSCKKDSGEETQPEPEQEQPVEEPTEEDDEWIGSSDATEGVIESDYVVNETLQDESLCSVQVLDKEVKKSIVSFGDSLYAVYFGTGLSKSLKYDVVENPEKKKDLESETRNFSNGKYKISVAPTSVNAPSWGPTEYQHWVNVVAVLHANKSVDVYIYPNPNSNNEEDKVFHSGGYLFMKLGNVNKGNTYNGECVHFKEGAPYVYFHINNFDEFAERDPADDENPKFGTKKRFQGKLFPLSDFGYVNIFPLILSNNGKRYYTNPIHIQTNTREYYNTEILPKDHETRHTHNSHPNYGKAFGTIDGVRVIHDGPGNGNCYDGCKWQTYQCSELCATYTKLVSGKNITQVRANLFHENNKSLLDCWGNVNTEIIDQAPHESDILEQAKGGSGNHVVIVSKVDYDNMKLYYSHQNSETSKPIMKEVSFQKVGDGKYKIKGFQYLLRAKCDSPKTAAEIDKVHKHVYDEPAPINLTCNLPASSVTIGDRLTLTVKTATECKLEIWTGDWKKVSDGYVRSYSVDLPTSAATASGRAVYIKAVSDEGLEEEKNVSYIVKEKKAPLSLSHSLNGSTPVDFNGTLMATFTANYECNIFVSIDNGSYSKYSNTSSKRITLPTGQSGNHTVKYYGEQDGSKSQTYSFSYYVNQKIEPKTPVLNVILSATSVEIGDNVRMTVSVDMDCDIKYTINNITKTYYSAVYLPTDAAGSYSVKVVATARDGGKSAYDTKSYTVSEKPVNPVLSYSFLPTQTVDYNGDLTLRITADIYCDVYLKVDGRSYDSRSSTSRCNFTLPTGVAGRHTVEFYGIRDNGQSQTYNSYYYVNEEIVVEEPYVDFGLPSGTLWAKCNVGASKPWEYGGYYAWGETSTKADNAYTPANYKYSNSNKYTSNDKLALSDDAAYINMGSDWRMPTTDDWEELVNNSNSEWVSNYDGTGVEGYIFRSKRYSDRFIFLPAAYLRSSSVTSGVGRRGNYWASNLVDGNAVFLMFDTQNLKERTSGRNSGLSVRAVKR